MSNIHKGITTIIQIDKAIKQDVKDGKTTVSPLTDYKELDVRIRSQKSSAEATAEYGSSI